LTVSKKRPFGLPFFLFGLISVSIALVLLFNISRSLWDNNSSETIFPVTQRIEIKIPAAGFLSKTEYLIHAPDDGKVERLQPPGELYRSNTEIIRLKKDAQETITITNEHDGLLTYIIDECEQHFTYDNIDQLLLQEILNPPTKQRKLDDNQSVKKGDFLFKIIQNDEMHFILAIEPRFKEMVQSVYKNIIKTGNDVNFKVESPTNLMIQGQIQRMEEREKDHLLLVISSPYYIDALLNNRRVSGYISFGHTTAFLLPVTAVLRDEEGNFFVFERKEVPTKMIVNVLGLDTASNHYIIEKTESTPEVYTHAKQWIENTITP
jgi:hypothetical protein